MPSILPVEQPRTSARARFLANQVFAGSVEVAKKTARSICALLFTKGFDATLTFFCTFCVFSVD